MQQHAQLSFVLTIISAILLATLTSEPLAPGSVVAWLVVLFCLGSALSAVHHRKVHLSFALDSVFLASALGLGITASILVLALIASMLEGSWQPHVLTVFVTIPTAFAGLFVIQFMYALGMHATKPMLVRSFIAAVILALIGVIIMQGAATITIHDQVENALDVEPGAGYALEERMDAVGRIEDTPIGRAIVSFRSDLHKEYENTREPLRACEGWLIDTVWRSRRIADSIVSTVDLVVVELLISDFAQDAANATPAREATLDVSDRASLEEALASFYPRFVSVSGAGRRLDSISAMHETTAKHEMTGGQTALVQIGDGTVLDRSLRSIGLASAYGSSVRDVVAAVMERTHAYRVYATIAAPAMLAEHDPALFDDPLFIAVTLERIEEHHVEL